MRRSNATNSMLGLVASVGGVWPPLLVFVLVTVAAELVIARGWVPAFLVAPPTAVFRSLYHDWSVLSHAAGRTALFAAEGLVRSAVIGIVVAMVLSSHPLLRRAFYPYAVFLQTVPIIAIAPLLTIWFGHGKPTVVASAFIASVFPVVAATLVGLSSTEPALRDMFRLYRAGPIATLFKLRLPSALPSIFTGLRVAAALSVIGAIVGEFVTNGGLGTLILVAKPQQRVDQIFAALILAAVIGIGFTLIVDLLARLMLRRWHASESTGTR